MWLKYGVDRDNALVSIEDALSGKTFLTCLYCGGGLTAKKGKIKEHHGSTHRRDLPSCRQSGCLSGFAIFAALRQFQYSAIRQGVGRAKSLLEKLRSEE